MKPGEEKGAEARFATSCATECRAISFRREGEICVCSMLEESADNRAKRRQVYFVKVDSRGAEALEKVEEMIRRSLDRDSGEAFGVRQSRLA